MGTGSKHPEAPEGVYSLLFRGNVSFCGPERADGGPGDSLPSSFSRSVPADEGRLTCLAARLPTALSHDISSHLVHFVPEEKKRIYVAAKRVDRLLELLQYPRLPSLHPRRR